jgi:hypothetical protein
MMTLCGFALSVLSSLTAILVLYLLYCASAAHVRQCVARAECWWLPSVNSFRFVIRNIPRKKNLFGIRYRAWLRKDVPASDAISVPTLLDTDLVQGERLLLPGQQDLPVICFRLDVTGPTLTLVLTDKMGSPQESHPIDSESTRLMVEFSVRARAWLLFKHEIFRLYAIPQYRVLAGKRRNIFREDLLPMQSSHEQEMKSVLQYADEVTVTV